MKKLMMTIITGITLAASVSISANAGEQIIVSGQQPDAIITSSEDRMYLKLCQAVLSNNKLHLNSTLKRVNVSYQQMQDGLVCNGQDPVTFAINNGSAKTAQLIGRHTRQTTNAILAKN